MNTRDQVEYDIAVIGGGPGGIPAAIAAARQGAKVLLVERNGFLGGAAASGLGLLGFLDRQGRKVLSGIPEEFVERLAEVGGTLGHNRCPVHNSITPIQPDIFRIIAIEKCRDAGVDLLMHCELLDVKVDNRKITKVVVFGKGHQIEINAKVVIDATGDGDVAYMAGASYTKGQDGTGLMQPASLMFTVGNVNLESFYNYIENNPSEIELPDTYDSGYTADFFRNTKGHCFIGLKGLLTKAKENGEYTIPRDRFIYIISPNKNQVAVNSTRILNIDATDPWELTRGETEGHLQILQLMKLLKKYVPGFDESYVSSIAPGLGIRETRRIKGMKTLTVDDMLSNKIPEDAICLGAYNIDIHHGAEETIKLTSLEKPYGIPYGCLVSKDIEGLLMSGRCISVDTQVYGSMRIMGTCMAIGEAAGVAAALSVSKGCMPSELAYQAVTDTLKNSGAILAI